MCVRVLASKRKSIQQSARLLWCYVHLVYVYVSNRLVGKLGKYSSCVEHVYRRKILGYIGVDVGPMPTIGIQSLVCRS